MKESSRIPNNYKQSLILGALLGITLAITFSAGFFFHDLIGAGRRTAAAQSEGSPNGYPLLDEVQALLERHYLRELPDATTLQYAAIRGVIGALQDRYTFFIDPPVARSESDVLAGTYGGIGVLLQRNEAGEFLLAPFPESSALKAGVKEGDILRKVNGNVIEISMQQDAVDQLLRGEVKDNNGVDLTYFRPSTREEFTTFVPFAVVNVPSVLWRVLDDDERIGYIQILNFTNRTPDELVTAITQLRESNVMGLVLDLRSNRGGLLQESIKVTGQFVDADKVVVYEKTSASERVYNTEAGGYALDLPLVVLVNGDTASAAELVAGAIKDYQRGVIIGQRTYGKGTVQQIYRLSDGSSVHITSAEFFTPNRYVLDGAGLEPDIAMIPDPNGRDVEIGEAIRKLQEMLRQ